MCEPLSFFELAFLIPICTLAIIGFNHILNLTIKRNNYKAKCENKALDQEISWWKQRIAKLEASQ